MNFKCLNLSANYKINMKTKKRIVQKTTLDKQHFQKIHEFDKDKENLLELKKNLRLLKKELS